MMMNEFTYRTGYEPTPEEYEEIELDYIAFEGDKDAFCKAWLGLYGWKVKAQKKERDAAARMIEAPWTFKHVVETEEENDRYTDKLFAARVGLRLIDCKSVCIDGCSIDYFNELPVVRKALAHINGFDRDSSSSEEYGSESMLITTTTEEARTALVLALLDMAAA